MNTKRVSTEAASSIRSTTTRRTSRRPSKLALLRVKVATIVVAVVLFFASLTGIAIYNPGVGNEAAVPVQAQQITIVKPGGSDYAGAGASAARDRGATARAVARILTTDRPIMRDEWSISNSR